MDRSAKNYVREATAVLLNTVNAVSIAPLLPVLLKRNVQNFHKTQSTNSSH